MSNQAEPQMVFGYGPKLTEEDWAKLSTFGQNPIDLRSLKAGDLEFVEITKQSRPKASR